MTYIYIAKELIIYLTEQRTYDFYEDLDITGSARE